MYMFATELKQRTNPVLFRVFRCKNYRATGHRCLEPKRELSANRVEWAARQCIALDLSSILRVADARAHWNVSNTTSMTDRRRAALVKRRTTAAEKHRKARDRWYEGAWSDALMDEADARLHASLAELDAELAALPVEPDWAAVAAFAEEARELAPMVLSLPDAAMGQLMRRLGVLRWDGETATMRYASTVAYLIPTPATLVIPKRVC